MSQAKANHAKAPIAAANVKALREVFGDVKVLYVKEGELELGENVEEIRATCFFYGTGKRIEELQREKGA